MSEEYESEIEEALWKTVEAFNATMNRGDYKKANELLDVLTIKKNEKNKIVEDGVVA